MDFPKQKTNKVEKPRLEVGAGASKQEVPMSAERVDDLAAVEADKKEAAYIEQQTGAEETITPAGPAIAQKSPYIVAVETILEEDLKDLYVNLPENKKEAFKKEGERVAGKIEKIIQSAKVSVSKIISLIRNWLLMIPGVNKLFLEQEAKIKADKILAVKEMQEKRK
ncbi:hypothetical protein HY932_02030 [Candidatus Falkowbacteria bacterium]|nr:hypothetical protein [Candidatus Falkowbacteria bacterium]